MIRQHLDIYKVELDDKTLESLVSCNDEIDITKLVNLDELRVNWNLIKQYKTKTVLSLL